LLARGAYTTGTVGPDARMPRSMGLSAGAEPRFGVVSRLLVAASHSLGRRRTSSDRIPQAFYRYCPSGTGSCRTAEPAPQGLRLEDDFGQPPDPRDSNFEGGAFAADGVGMELSSEDADHAGFQFHGHATRLRLELGDSVLPADNQAPWRWTRRSRRRRRSAVAGHHLQQAIRPSRFGSACRTVLLHELSAVSADHSFCRAWCGCRKRRQRSI